MKLKELCNVLYVGTSLQLVIEFNYSGYFCRSDEPPKKYENWFITLVEANDEDYLTVHLSKEALKCIL